MATVPYSTLQLANPNAVFSSSSTRAAVSLLKFNFQHRQHLSLTLTTTCRATANEDDSTEDDQTQLDSSSSSDPDSFDDRLSQIQVRYRSGEGKKAEVRKTKKGKKGSSGSGSTVFLPPVPLKEPVSEGLIVEFGFSPYSEKMNGRIAVIGLTALMLVELATGKGVINYHTPAIILIQLYFMAAASALYVKYEKEKVSIWPQSSPAEK